MEVRHSARWLTFHGRQRYINPLSTQVHKRRLEHLVVKLNDYCHRRGWNILSNSSIYDQKSESGETLQGREH